MGVFYQDNVNASLSHTAAYTYDALNRLETAAATGNSTYNLPFSYTADGSGGRFGNVTCVINGGTSGDCPTYTFNQTNNRITNTGYTYDAAGNLTSDGTNTYQYDGEGRLASLNNSTTEFYVYNALGAKARIVIQGSPADLFSDPAGAMLGDSGSWAVLWPIAGHAGDIYFQGSDVEFYHADGVDSTRMVTSAAGAVSEQVLFYPWGQVWEHPGWGGWNFASIPWYDTTGDLNLAAHRDYSFGLGRWLSPDPAGMSAVDLSNPQSWNAYSYAGNNPTTNTDPSGEDYNVCTYDENGNQSCTRVTDDQAFQQALSNPGAGITTSFNSQTNQGTIYVTGANGKQQLAGTFQWVPPSDAVLPNNGTFFGAAVALFGGGLGIVKDLGEAGGEETASWVGRTLGAGETAAPAAAEVGVSAYPTEIAGYRVSEHVFERMAEDLGHRVPSQVVEQVIRGGQTFSGRTPDVVIKYLPTANINGVTVALKESTREIIMIRVGAP